MHPRTGAGDVHIGGGEDGRHLVAECEINCEEEETVDEVIF